MLPTGDNWKHTNNALQGINLFTAPFQHYSGLLLEHVRRISHPGMNKINCLSNCEMHSTGTTVKRIARSLLFWEELSSLCGISLKIGRSVSHVQGK